MAHPRRRGYSAMATINITSLVDVTMCMLIIFMLTAPYIQGGVEVNLPETETRETIVKEGPVISVTASREVFFQEQAVSMDELGRPAGALGRPEGQDPGLPALRRRGAVRVRAETDGGGRTRRLRQPEPGGRPAGRDAGAEALR